MKEVMQTENIAELWDKDELHQDIISKLKVYQGY